MLVANNNYEILDNNQQDEYNIVLKASNGDKIALEYIIKKYKKKNNFFFYYLYNDMNNDMKKIFMSSI